MALHGALASSALLILSVLALSPVIDRLGGSWAPLRLVETGAAQVAAAPVAQIPAGGLPDLVVTLSDSPDPVNNAVNEDPPLSYTVTVRNQGTAATTANFAPGGARLFVLHLPPGLAVPDDGVVPPSSPATCTRQQVPGADEEQAQGHSDFNCHINGALGAGAAIEVEFHVGVNLGTCGSRTAAVRVDPDFVQVESSDDNNRATTTTRIDCADLDVLFQDAPPGEDLDTVGGYVSLARYTLFNDGLEPIDSVTFQGTVGGTATRDAVTPTVTGGNATWGCTSTLASWSCSGALDADDSGGYGDDLPGGDGPDQVTVTIAVVGTGANGDTVVYTPQAPTCSGAVTPCTHAVASPANSDGSGLNPGPDTDVLVGPVTATPSATATSAPATASTTPTATRTATPTVTSTGTPTTPTLTMTPNPALPDLIIESMRIEPEVVGACGSVALGVRVQFKSFYAASGPFQVEVNGVRQGVPGLAADQIGTLWFAGFRSGEDNVAIVDVLNQVAEQNEGNNQLAAQLPVPTPAATCTPTPSLTSTLTPTPTRTATVATSTPTATAASTNTRTATPSPSATATVPVSATPTATPPATATVPVSATPTSASLATPTRTATALPPATASATVTPTPTLAVGGRNLVLQSGNQVMVTWDRGALETGYLMIRYSQTLGNVFFPSDGTFLAPARAGVAARAVFTDTPPSTDSAYCYIVLAFGGSPTSINQFLGLSDLLCVYPFTASGTPPTQMRIRLNESPIARLDWVAPGGQDAYRLTAVTFDGAPPRQRDLPGDLVTVTDDTQQKPTCYTLQARLAGQPLGSADTVCAVPGIAFFTASGGARAGQVELILRQLQQLGSGVPGR